MNSLFFDYPCKGDDREEGGAVSTDLAWCKSENLLACALDSGRVAIYQDEVISAGVVGAIDMLDQRIQTS